MRLTRLLFGLAVLFIALWILIGEQLAGVSADAVINARLTAVRAPIAGNVSLAPVTLGARVQAGDSLGSVEDPLSDSLRLDDLTMELAFETAALARETSIVQALEDQIAALEERTVTLHSQRIAVIDARLAHARARLSLLEADPSAEDNALASTLAQGQTDNPGDPLLPGVALEYALERVAALEIERQAAEQSVYLGDGYNDAPWSEQWQADLSARLAEHQSLRADAEARVAAVAARLDAERVRVNFLSTASLTSAVSGVVWEMRTASGENVQRGDELLKLMDCGSVLVTVSVTESIYNSLSVGDPATFRPHGDSRTFEGTVARLAGAGAETVYRNLAVAPSERHLQRYDVSVNVPGLVNDAELACAVGRTGRVFFDARPLDWLRGLFAG